MNVEISIPEVVDLFKQPQKREEFFEMIRYNIQEEVGKYFSELMDLEPTHLPGQER